MTNTENDRVASLLSEAKRIAAEFYKLTGKPLGVTGEVGEFEAARIMNLTLAEAREAGFDAIDTSGRKIQIKARCVDHSRNFASKRIGSIKVEHEWDAVLLVLMTLEYEAFELWEAKRPVVVAALRAPGSKARNERGSLSISKFKQLGECVWRKIN